MPPIETVTSLTGVDPGTGSYFPLSEIQSGTFLNPGSERWALVSAMPEAIEHTRLCKLQDVHFGEDGRPRQRDVVDASADTGGAPSQGPGGAPRCLTGGA